MSLIIFRIFLKKMKKYLFFIFLLCSKICVAQKNNIEDSLIQQTKVAAPDSQKIKSYYALAKYYTNKEDSANAVNTYLKGIAFAQNKNLLKWAAHGYNQLGFLYELMQENKLAIGYYNKAIVIGKENKLYEQLGTAYSNMAFSIMNTGNYEKAIVYDDSAIVAYEKGNLQVLKANSLNNQGLRYFYSGKPLKSLPNYYKALAIYEAYNEEKRKANTILNIGQVNLQQKNYDVALEYFFKAREIAIKTSNIPSQHLAENNIGVVYFEQKKFAEAIPYFQKALELAKQTKNKKEALKTLTNIGSCYESLQQYEKAQVYYKQSEEELLKTNNYEELTINAINQASLNGRLKNYKESLEYCDKAFSYINKSQGLGRYKQHVFETQAAVNKELGNYAKAMELQDSQMYYKDFYINEKSNKEILDLQTKYETEAKQLKINLLSKEDSIKGLRLNNQAIQLKNQQLSLAQQKFEIAEAQLRMADDSLFIIKQNEVLASQKFIAINKEQEIKNLASEKKLKDLELSKKNTLLIALSLFIPLLLLAGFLFFKQKKQQQENLLQQQLHLQQEKNMMAVLEAEERERKRIAAELHDGIGQTMTAAWMNMQSALNSNNSNEEKKAVFQNALSLLDESCKEIRVISHNMMPNVLLKKGLVNAVKDFLAQIHKQDLNINIEADGLNKPIPQHIESVLYRVIQEAVNNVVKHAKATELFITLYNEAEGIDVMIEDNGVGFDKNNITSNGIGLQNIKSRIEFLKGNIEWDTAPNNGTVLSIHVPL